MSSLQRYKKTGGFVQLVSLIESFPPQKKEKFLEVVESESRIWAQALRDKMLTVERVFGWPDHIVAEVFKRVNPKTMAYFLFGLSDDVKARFHPMFTASEHRRMADLLAESSPKTDEVSSTRVKVIEAARQMMVERILLPDRFDAGLAIPEDFEAQLENQAGPVANTSGRRSASAMNSNLHMVAANASASATATATATGSVSAAELAQLQQTLNMVLRENRMLKDELKLLHDKLEQIRRIA